MAGIRVGYAEILASRVTTSTLDRNRQDSANSSTKKSLVTVEKPTLPEAARNLSKHNQTGACTLSCPFYCNSGYLKFENTPNFVMRACRPLARLKSLPHLSNTNAPSGPSGSVIYQGLATCFSPEEPFGVRARSDRSAIAATLSQPQATPERGIETGCDRQVGRLLRHFALVEVNWRYS